MKVFILLSVFAVAFAAFRDCPENSHYESCGTACPLTCENYANPPRACILMCNPGCHCDEGYVKHEDGSCVKPEECSAATSEFCGENERFSSCGTACPLTCDNFNNLPKICPLMCKIGCECEKGFVRSSEGRCVRPEQCPSRAESCGENERYSTCGTACPLTCDNFNNPPKICPLMCKIGCECEKGFVRGSDGRCVRPEQCPSRTDVCGENERFFECGTACPLTCENYKNPVRVCPAMCVIGCQCEKGYVKSSDGRCIRPEECDSRSASAEACDLPAETGVCRGFFSRFYFDRTTGQCQKFVYGGCGGNENNFETIEECQQACGIQSGPEVCSLEAEVGLCRGYFPRYYYNEEKRRCQKFIYGGCGGNENNFETLEACQKACAA